MIVHFMGPKAHQIEMDLTKLLSTGRLDAPSVSTPGFDDPLRKKTLAYKQCSVQDPNDKKKKKNNFAGFSFSQYSGAASPQWSSWGIPLLAAAVLPHVWLRHV